MRLYEHPGIVDQKIGSHRHRGKQRPRFASASRLLAEMDGTVPFSASTARRPEVGASKCTHDAEEPSPKGVDRHFGVIRLGDDSADGWEGARIRVPIPFDIVLADDPRQIDLELDEMAIENV